MKKINLLLIAVLVSAVGFMTSCDGDDETITPKPVITFTSDNSGVVMPGDSIDITGNITAEGEIVSIKYFKGLDQYGATVTDDFNTKTTHTFSIRIAGDANFTFEVQVEDKEGQTGKNNVGITIQNTSISEYTVTLGDQNDSPGSFIGLLSGEVFTSTVSNTNSGAGVDLLHYWGVSGDASLYSVQGAIDVEIYGSTIGGIDMRTWDNISTTKLIKAPSADYDNIDYASLTDGAANATDMGLNLLAEGDLVFFKTDGGLSGLIKVGAVNQTKTITDMTYKIQDEAPVTK